MHSTRMIAAFLFSAVIFSCSGYAHFTVPAPSAPVKPSAVPVIEDSIINLPVSLPLKSLSKIIGGKLPGIKNSDNLNDNEALTGKVQRFLNRQVAKIDNNEVVNSIFLQEGASLAWEALQYPIPLKNGLALLLNPQAIHVSSPSAQQGHEDTVTVVVGLVVRPKVIDDTSPQSASQPVPQFSTAPTGSGFHVALESDLSYDYASSELAKSLESRLFKISGNTIKIKTVKIYGSGDSLILHVRITGTLNGTVYLSGVPAYDELSRCLYVRNLDYTVETKQVLVKAGDWMFHAKVRETLRNKAKWYLGGKIDEVDGLLAKALNRNLSQHVLLSGIVYSIRPVTVGLTDKSLRAVLVADGTVELKLL